MQSFLDRYCRCELLKLAFGGWYQNLVNNVALVIVDFGGQT